MDSQIGFDNVVKQRCCITKLQPTYNLRIKIALNLINVCCFKYQLNFFTLDFLKGYSWPPNFNYPIVTILSYNIIYFCCNIVPNFPPVLVMELLWNVPPNFQLKGLYLYCLVGLHQNNARPLARPIYISFMT